MAIDLPEAKTEREILILLVQESNRQGDSLDKQRQAIERMTDLERGCPLSRSGAGMDLIKRVDKTMMIALAALVLSFANASPTISSGLGSLLKLIIH